MTLWVSRAPLLCTAAALTWIQVVRGVEIGEKAQPGCCQQPRQRVAPSTPVRVRFCSKSRRWHLCLHEGRRLCTPASKNAPGCVHLCICSVFTKGEGLSAFNYSTVKDPTFPFPEPLTPQILIHYWEALPEESRPLRKPDTITAWAAALISPSKHYFYQLVLLLF